MKRCLVDANLWFALVVRHHPQHSKAARWFDGCGVAEALLCRFTQLALMRLLGSKAILQDRALSALEAWRIMTELLADERVELEPEPVGFDDVFPTLLRYPMPTPKLVGDAYLAGFAISAGLELVTFDKGFREFRGLSVRLL